jgi:exodeoxyribonuclease V alpha subunit
MIFRRVWCDTVLLYTAVTRAKRIVVLVGRRRALWKAVTPVGAGRRHMALAWRLARHTRDHRG